MEDELNYLRQYGYNTTGITGYDDEEPRDDFTLAEIEEFERELVTTFRYAEEGI